MARVTRTGPGKVRTSIDVDPRILAVFEAKAINKSAWFDRMAKLYFGLTDVTEEIQKLQSMDAAIAIARQEDDKRELEKQRREMAALANAQAEELQAVATKDRAESHIRKLRDTWLVLVKKKRILESTLIHKLPENDLDMNHEDYWPTLARDISKAAGEDYTAQEIIDYAVQQVARV